MFALLGPNGAGKTTTVEILEGFRTRDAPARSSVLGHDPAEREPGLRERIGIVLQSTGVDPYLTVRETVEMYAGYYPHPAADDEVIDARGPGGEARHPRQQALGRAAAAAGRGGRAVGDPELLFLDEPTTGFDPNAPPQRVGDRAGA